MTDLIARLRWLLESPATDDRWTWYSGEYVRLAADALEAQGREIAALRELMNCYNLGGWTDAERLQRERDEARAQLAEAIEDAATYKQERDEIVVNYQSLAARLAEAEAKAKRLSDAHGAIARTYAEAVALLRDISKWEGGIAFPHDIRTRIDAFLGRDK